MSDPVLEALTRLESGYGEMVPEHRDDVGTVTAEIGSLRILVSAYEQMLRKAGHRPDVDGPEGDNYGCPICEAWHDIKSPAAPADDLPKQKTVVTKFKVHRT
jgi:hypothetical protein